MLVMAVSIATTSNSNASVGGTSSVTVTTGPNVSCSLTCTNGENHGVTVQVHVSNPPSGPTHETGRTYTFGGYCNGDTVEVDGPCPTWGSDIVVNGELLDATDTATAHSDGNSATYTLGRSQHVEWDSLAESYIGYIDVTVSKGRQYFCQLPPEEQQ